MELKPFQETGRDFLARNPRALLADQMRLGKTVQALAAADKIKARKVLVVCPAFVRGVWKAHHRGLATGHCDTFRVVSYDEARMKRPELTKTNWDVLIVDESHYCKTPSAQRTKAVFGKDGVARKARFVWALTGTPALNHAGELWVLLRTFGVVKMGYGDFINRYCSVDFFGKIAGTKPERMVELRRLLSRIMLRRLKKDVAPELPEYTVERWPVLPNLDFLDLTEPWGTKRSLKRYDSELEHLKRALEKRSVDDRARYLASRGSSSEYATVRRVNALIKAASVYDAVKAEIKQGLSDKLVVFGYHRQPLATMFELLKGDDIKVELVYGGTPDKKRERALKKFNRPTDRGGTQVFLGQILAAGQGIDLSAAHEGFFIDKSWVPGQNAQALERMGGFRQKHPITIRDAYLPNGLDDVVNSTLDRKMHELAAFLN